MSDSISAEPLDEVFSAIPPEEFCKTVEILALLEEKKVVNKGVNHKLTKLASAQDSAISYIPLYEDSDDAITVTSDKYTKLDKNC